MKTKISMLLLLFMVSIISVHAQINVPNKTTIKNTQIKNNLKPNLTYSLKPIDGIIGQRLDGRYQIYWVNNDGEYCCAKTLKEAVNTYPKKNLKYVTSGNRGFVYEETANGSIGKKISNVHIAFKNIKNNVTHYAHTNKYGNYKIALLSGKYIVSIQQKGYKNYTTAPSVTVIQNKLRKYNIPLQKLKKQPFKKYTKRIVAVFNTKTNKLIDIVLVNKNPKKEFEKRPNTATFYGTLTSTQNIQKNTRKKYAKGSSIIVYLNKKYLPGDAFTPSNEFLPGDAFTLFNTKFKIVSNTKDQLKMVVQ